MKNYNHPVRQFLSRMRCAMPPAIQELMQPVRAVLARHEARRQMEQEILPAAAFIRQHAESHKGAKIVVDCGFNTGVVLQAFLKELPDFEFYGFEVNPEFGAVATHLKTEFPNILELDFAAVSDKDGEVTYFLSGDAEGVHVHEGTTMMPGKQSYMTDYDRPFTERSVDFARWLEDKAAQHTNSQGRPFIAVKMDIEGAEVPVLEHLIATHAIKHIDVLVVEFHAGQFDVGLRADMRAREEKILKDLKNYPTEIYRWF